MIKTLPSLVEKTRNEDMPNKHTVQFAAYEMMDTDSLLTRQWMDEANDLDYAKRYCRAASLQNKTNVK